MAVRRPIESLGTAREFLRTEAGGGVILLGATVLALVWANSPARGSYDELWLSHVGGDLGFVRLDLTLREWVNEALMAIFFLVAGLEIKRELVQGELSEFRKALLPLVAALGGMLLPAALYLLVTAGGAGSRGWGIPVATDIAFAVGVLALLSKGLPGELRTFLLTLAVADDIGAILVIAVFYSSDVSIWALVVAALAALSLLPLRKLELVSFWWYIPSGVILWLALHEAGVHSTLAGVLLGLLTPVAVKGRPVLTNLEHRLHPWSSYLIVPLFALANAGVALGLGELRVAFTPAITWGVIAGLVLGKTLGVFASAWLATSSGLARLPANVRGAHLLGVGGLAGIGFTVSLFVAALAFTEGSPLLTQAKIGVLTGSLLSALLGATILLISRRRFAGDLAGDGQL